MRPLALACLFGLLAVACGDGAPGTATPVYNPQSRELERIDYDYDSNGVADVRTFMQAGKPVRLEGDANGDGKTDRWEYYDAQGQVTRLGASSRQDGIEDTWIVGSGRDTRMDLSLARDGRIDRREFYRDNVLLRAEADTDRDGRLDRWEAYDNGRLAMVALDEDQRGRATRRLVYARDGQVRVEVDPDGDGEFDPVPVSGEVEP